MWPRPSEVGLVIARTANKSNKIDFRRHIWLSVADQITASLVRRNGPGSNPGRRYVHKILIIRRFSWLPFLDTYRTMCVAPEPDFLRLLDGVREMGLAEPGQIARGMSPSG
jgi:hypothetical protein